ncbi:MAG: hemolysin family protein [Pseudomonadota bacterium]
MNTPTQLKETGAPAPDDPEPSTEAVAIGANLPVVYAPPEAPALPSFFQRLAYVFRPRANASIRQNLEEALGDVAAHDSTISPAERAMLENILRLREVRVADVMVARAEIEAVEMSTRLDDLLIRFESSGHSRLPVYFENLDDPRGMVHIRDIVGYILETSRKKRRRSRKTNTAAAKPVKNGKAIQAISDFDLEQVELSKTIADLNIDRPVLFVPPSMLATDLMARMQAERTQMALVIDEYGGTDGLVSLEDIVEMVVGDIEDEHDEDDIHIEERADGSLRVDARAELEDLSKHKQLGENFLTAAHGVEDEVDTIGGLIFSILGRVPIRGEVVHGLTGYEIEVCDADARRIRSAIIKPVKQNPRRRAMRSREGAVPPQ